MATMMSISGALVAAIISCILSYKLRRATSYFSSEKEKALYSNKGLNSSSPASHPSPLTVARAPTGTKNLTLKL